MDRVMLCKSLMDVYAFLEQQVGFKAKLAIEEKLKDRVAARARNFTSASTELETYKQRFNTLRDAALEELDQTKQYVDNAKRKMKKYGSNIDEIFAKRLNGHEEHMHLLQIAIDQTDGLLEAQEEMKDQTTCCVLIDYRTCRRYLYCYMGCIIFIIMIWVIFSFGGA
eukprot:g850.t1